MNRSQILKYNKRCAMFLSEEPEVLKRDLMKAGTLESMQCHSDWNWIMKMVEAIEKLEVSNKDKTNIDYALYRKSDKVCCLPIYTPKEEVVQAIDQFLIWYEKNK